MIRVIFIFSLLILISSCYNENKLTDEVPDPMLTEEQIVELLTNIQTAEAVLSFNRVHRENTDQEFKDSLYQQIFDHFDMTADEINENLDYYNNYPEKMEIIYEKVLSNLSKRQSEIEAESRKDTIQEK